MLIEFGYQSGTVIAAIAEEAKADGRIARYAIRRDLSGNDRMLEIEV